MIFKLQKIRDAEKENKTTQFKDTEGKKKDRLRVKIQRKMKDVRGGKNLIKRGTRIRIL